MRKVHQSFVWSIFLAAQLFSGSAHSGLAYVADTRGGPGGAIGNTLLHDYPPATKEAEMLLLMVEFSDST